MAQAHEQNVTIMEYRIEQKKKEILALRDRLVAIEQTVILKDNEIRNLRSKISEQQCQVGALAARTKKKKRWF